MVRVALIGVFEIERLRPPAQGRLVLWLVCFVVRLALAKSHHIADECLDHLVEGKVLPKHRQLLHRFSLRDSGRFLSLLICFFSFLFPENLKSFLQCGLFLKDVIVLTVDERGGPFVGEEVAMDCRFFLGVMRKEVLAGRFRDFISSVWLSPISVVQMVLLYWLLLQHAWLIPRVKVLHFVHRPMAGLQH